MCPLVCWCLLQKVSAIGGGVEFALDTSGNKNALRAAFDSLRPLGVCGLIGGAGTSTIAILIA
jgi:threonine dehydrogenase-like Zn-dependent dehydrogenase